MLPITRSRIRSPLPPLPFRFRPLSATAATGEDDDRRAVDHAGGVNRDRARATSRAVACAVRRRSKGRRQRGPDSVAGRRAKARARPPSPPPASRRWASDARPASRIIVRSPAPGPRPARRGGAGQTKARQSRRKQFVTSSSRAAAQPNAAVAAGAVAHHAVHRVHRLVDEHSGQAEKHVPERRCHDAVGEVFGAGLDRRPRDAVLVELSDVTPTMCAT